MYAKVLLLRHDGVLSPHASEDWMRAGDAFFVTGMVVTGRHPEGPNGLRCLLICKDQAYQGDPFRLYQPTVVDVASEYIHFRGVESVRRQNGSMAAVLQDWVVFPKPKPGP